jgi:hypothetical protein
VKIDDKSIKVSALQLYPFGHVPFDQNNKFLEQPIERRILELLRSIFIEFHRFMNLLDLTVSSVLKHEERLGIPMCHQPGKSRPVVKTLQLFHW